MLPSPTSIKTARSVILDAAAKLRMLRPGLAAFVTCSALAVVMGVRNADSLNHDAVSYVTLAQHYLDGRFDLVVVGHWSPLFVWLLVPLVAATGDHGLSLHLLSGFSALVFLTGGLAALRAFAPRSGVAPGAIVLAVYGAVRSGALLTPDLLSAGLFGLATARIIGLTLAPTPSASQWATAGALIGLCYLAKQVLLPIGVLCLLMVLGARILLHGMRPRLAARAAAGTLAGVLLVGGPWVTALSFKYGTPTFSTAGATTFATIGPPDVDRDHPTNRLFVIPEPGRQSQFEDESILPQASWSPLDSPRYARHFAWFIANNVGTITGAIGELDVLHLGLPAAVAGLVLLLRRREPSERWYWSGVFVVGACAVYLATFANQVRYFYIVYPHLLAASFGLAGFLVNGAAPGRWRTAGTALVTVSFLYGCYTALRDESVRTSEYASVQSSRVLATRIRAADMAGPVAALNPSHKHGAIYTSYLLGTAYHGTEKARTVERLRASGARLLIVRRGSDDETFLLSRPDAAGDLDMVLFGRHPPIPEMGYRVFVNRNTPTRQE